MIKLDTYYCKDYNGKDTNVGDILTPYIFKKIKIYTSYSEKNVELYGIGSLFNGIPQNFTNNIWSTGFLMRPKDKLFLKKAPYAVRGKYTLSCLSYDNSPIALGDGGLIISNFYDPIVQKKYKLGIVCHYVENDYSSIKKEYNIFNNPDVIFIDVKDPVEVFIDKINMCQNIISSSLHGLIISDSYSINNGIFSTPSTQKSLHDLKDSYKFKDYYSSFNMPMPEILKLNEKTTLEECLSHCKPFNKFNIDVLKYYLQKSLLTLKEDIIKEL
jgi:pyruvyltransferase